MFLLIRLSLQSHKFRSEHWLLKGNKIVLNDEIRFLETNQSIYIPAGSKHRLENETEGALIVIEVQTGYLGEDDILRFEDDYRRID